MLKKDKPTDKVVLTRLPADMHKKLKSIAKKQRRSISRTVEILVENYLAQNK